MFPTIKRLENSKHGSTPVSYYRLRMDRTPPQHELFNLCLISKDDAAFLKMFEVRTNQHTFIAPTMTDISTILLAPADQEWPIKHFDLEVQTRTSDTAGDITNTITRYVPYYGPIETSCMFVPDRQAPVNEEKRIEGIATYSRQKGNANLYTISFLAGGSCFLQVTSGAHSTFAFVLGCAVGILYQLLLQYEIDHLGKNQMFVNSTSRLAIVAVVAAALIQNMSDIVPADIWIGSSGFLMQKAALWIAFL